MKPQSSLDPEAVITEIYPVGSRTRDLLLRHGERVAEKALDVLDRAPRLVADRDLVVAAAMLHDIGIGRTRSPQLGCAGDLPYVCHGVEGKRILDAMGLTDHSRICECHVGVGIRAEQILRRRLPLPVRDMVPRTLEERLICYADKFFSKSEADREEKPIAEIMGGLARYGRGEAQRFLELHRQFAVPAG